MLWVNCLQSTYKNSVICTGHSHQLSPSPLKKHGFLPPAHSSRWADRRFPSWLSFTHISTTKPTLLNPSFLSGWTFWLLLGFSPSLSVHSDRPSLEIVPWQKGAQVRWLGKLGAGQNNSTTVMSLRLCSGYPLGPSVPPRGHRGPRRKQMYSANL